MCADSSEKRPAAYLPPPDRRESGESRKLIQRSDAAEAQESGAESPLFSQVLTFCLSFFFLQVQNEALNRSAACDVFQRNISG